MVKEMLLSLIKMLICQILRSPVCVCIFTKNIFRRAQPLTWCFEMHNMGIRKLIVIHPSPIV